MSVFECCKDFQKRHPLCHADCPDKAAADAEHQARKKKARQNSPVIGYFKDRTKKMKRERQK